MHVHVLFWLIDKRQPNIDNKLIIGGEPGGVLVLRHHKIWPRGVS